ncbi:MAG: sulfatase-like hydrolase/transferase, partial [Planctomycetes bacterium]|nr:sulfatase-like hydrolase/transferase [Planctomycetota bacterium]
DRQAFEQWVTLEIQKPREPVPLPTDPVLAEPKWPCQRLDQTLDQAAITCAWQGIEAGNKPLITLGPFRSDEPAATFAAEKTFDRMLGWGFELTVSGFQVQSGEVGRVSIDIHAPYGRHLDLRWSEGGFMRIPVPDNERSWKLDLLTDGLTNWAGQMDTFMLRSDGFEEGGVFEIRSLSFYGHEDAFVEPVGQRRISVERQRRSAIYAHCPAEVRFVSCPVPTDAKLTTGLAALLPDRGQSADSTAAEVDFEIVVEHDDESVTVFDRRLNVGGGWTDISLSLAQWSEQDISLSLRTHAEQPGVVALWGSPTIYQPVADPPIMILYLIDALAAKHCSLYGYERPTTPRLEGLAERGVWFAHAYANSPVTVTSVPDIQLSMPTERHGVYHSSIAAPLELVTIADALSAAGFATASFITNANAGVRQNMDQGFDEFFPRALFHWHERTSADRSVPIEQVLDWFAKHRDRPAFVYIHTCEPHAPYVPPAGFRGLFDPDYRGPIDGSLSERTGFFAAESPRDIEHVQALYDEECLYADARLGMFLDTLGTAGLLDRVNVFVIADHGEELQEHGHWGHGLGLYNEVLRVPLVAAGPSITARGRQNLQANLYDIMPTILDLFDAPQPYQLSGTSLRTLMQDDAGEPPAELSPERTTITSHHRHRGRGQIEYAVVEARRWKLHYRYMLEDKPAYPRPTRFELYDLKNDADERHDLIDERPDVARRLMCKLVAYAREQHPYDTGLSEEGLDFDADQLQELIDLGYIERGEGD